MHTYNTAPDGYNRDAHVKLATAWCGLFVHVVDLRALEALELCSEIPQLVIKSTFHRAFSRTGQVSVLLPVAATARVSSLTWASQFMQQTNKRRASELMS